MHGIWDIEKGDNYNAKLGFALNKYIAYAT